MSDGTYSAELLLESRLDGELPEEPLFEYRVVTLHAASAKEAQELLGRYLPSAAESFRNEFGQTVEWHVMAVLRLEPVLSLAGRVDGHEVWSQTLTPDEVAWFRRMREIQNSDDVVAK